MEDDDYDYCYYYSYSFVIVNCVHFYRCELNFIIIITIIIIIMTELTITNRRNKKPSIFLNWATLFVLKHTGGLAKYIACVEHHR